MKKILSVWVAMLLATANAMGQWGNGIPYVARSSFVPTDTSWAGLHGKVRTVEWQQTDTLDDGEVVKDTLFHRYDQSGHVIEIVCPWQEEYPWTYFRYKDGRINQVINISTTDSMRLIYHYSPDGCLKEVIFDYMDGMGNDTIAFRCDAQCRITSERSRLAARVSHIYNAQGLLVKHIYENGDTCHYTYNEKNQIIKTVSKTGGIVRTCTYLRNTYGDVVDQYIIETDRGTTHHHFDYTYDIHGNWLTCRSGTTVTTRKITYHEP